MTWLQSNLNGLVCQDIKPVRQLHIPAMSDGAEVPINTRQCFEVEPPNRITHGWVDDPTCFCAEGKQGNCWCPDPKIECIRLGDNDEFMPSKSSVDVTNDVTEGNQWLTRKDNGYRVYYLN